MQASRQRPRPKSICPALWLCTLSLVIGDPGGAFGVDPDRFLAGQLLVATTDMRDPRFSESVIYIVKHDATGAMGLVISKPIAKAPLDDLLKGLGAKPLGAKQEVIIHYGGPVAPRQGFLLHSDEFVLDRTIKIADGIAMTSDIKVLQAMARGHGPRQVLFMLGYAGWAPGQLEWELEMNSWFVIPGEKKLIFGTDAEKKWRLAVDKRQIPS